MSGGNYLRQNRHDCLRHEIFNIRKEKTINFKLWSTLEITSTEISDIAEEEYENILDTYMRMYLTSLIIFNFKLKLLKKEIDYLTFLTSKRAMRINYNAFWDENSRYVTYHERAEIEDSIFEFEK